jgi:paraquat-inducible protein B
MNGGHFKLGLFVTVGVTLLVLFLLTLGVLDRFRPTVRAETYFVESIQSLQRGAAVRFRGVQLGVVDSVGFAVTEYGVEAEQIKEGPFRSYIMVRMSLYRDVLVKAGVEDPESHIRGNVEEGLRARLSSTGLGGPTFVEIDFLDPAAFPGPPIMWTPESIYVPSSTSTVVSIVDALSSILRKVDEMSLIEELAAVGKDLRRVLGDAEGSGLAADAGGALGELRAASAEVRALLADPRLDGILDDAGAAFTGARTLLEADRDEIETLLADATKMARTLDRAGTSLDALATTVNESDLIPRLQALADDLGPAGKDLSAMAQRLERLIKGNDQQIADAIRALRDAALELDAMLEDLKANPSSILSAPPPKRTPGGGS